MQSGAYRVPGPPTHFTQNLDEARSGRHLGVGRYCSDTAVGKAHHEPHAGADGDTGSVLGPSTGPEPSKARSCPGLGSFKRGDILLLVVIEREFRTGLLEVGSLLTSTAL